MSAKVNDDLLSERRKCEFNVEELTNYLDGGAQATQNRRKMEDKVLSTKGLFDEVPEEYLSHKEKYENAVRKAVVYYKAMKEAEDPTQTEQERANATYRSLLHTAVFKDNSPFSLHLAMFIPAILGQADEEQRKYWMKRASKMEIIGTYAQTELGHGTFIRGLETTATYDPKTEEFILHSPTLTSYKWWPGSLAHTANYCVVMAHLYINGKSCGVQPFIVQLRDEETHQPLPGIKLGEIGAKLGFNTVNNGFLGFDQHRIPRNRMLMKNAQVLKDGTFKRSPNSKLTYGTMVYVRVVIVNGMANQLARAVTIAVRYSAVRRQSELKPDAGEPQILDYVTQQHKLFIGIASSHAFSLTAKWLTRMYQKVTADLEKGNLDELPELHAIACCLKAVTTTDTSVLVERSRMSCGGHGYMLSSNLPQIYGLVTAACTYEGENTVLMLQTARSLVKAWEQAQSGKRLSPTMSYLSEKVNSRQKWDNSVDGIVNGFRRVAYGKVESAVKSIRKYVRRGLGPEDAWNMSSVQLVAASEAHCRAFLLSTYKSEVDRTAGSLSQPLKKVLNYLVELYAIYWALEKVGDLLLYTSISKTDIHQLQETYEELLGKIRPNAVGLVDAFDFRDQILNSTLGAYDGRVYERLMEEALKSPLNAEPVNQSFHKYLKPFMQGKL
ncbi:probable peroxisomal acyl-coenzyme A oxidase 1 [Spodoptera frugiperda]|uniref:Acyl-coenzyme A oxidase n=2 Tax=Spodoptera frugiperda TaxID=7108 RepID=A0A9R0EXU2_SPOFR|nr:probable peroxisomal acyl-coenzyme A oxidase 1 [Spodoptera frugiperda]